MCLPIALPRLSRLDDERGGHDACAIHRIPPRWIGMRVGRERRIERRLHERLDLESRLDHPHDERTERKTMGDYRNTFPRRVLARTFRTVRGRHCVSSVSYT